jgi:hypothetical protein
MKEIMSYGNINKSTADAVEKKFLTFSEQLGEYSVEGCTKIPGNHHYIF